MKNHESRPTGSRPFPEVNAVTKQSTHHGRGRGYKQGRGRGKGRGCGDSKPHFKRTTNDKGRRKENDSQNNQDEKLCYRCGGKGHWSRVCRTPKHLVDLYQKSLKNKNQNKGKESKFESNFADIDGDFDFDNMKGTHLEIEDFFDDANGNIGHLINNGIVQK